MKKKKTRKKKNSSPSRPCVVGRSLLRHDLGHDDNLGHARTRDALRMVRRGKATTGSFIVPTCCCIAGAAMLRPRHQVSGQSPADGMLDSMLLDVPSASTSLLQSSRRRD